MRKAGKRITANAPKMMEIPIIMIQRTRRLAIIIRINSVIKKETGITMTTPSAQLCFKFSSTSGKDQAIGIAKQVSPSSPGLEDKAAIVPRIGHAGIAATSQGRLDSIHLKKVQIPEGRTEGGTTGAMRGGKQQQYQY